MPLLPIFQKSPFARLLIFYAAGITTAYCFAGMSSFKLMVVTGFLLVLLVIRFVMMKESMNYNTGLRTGLVSSGIVFMAGMINMDMRHQTALRMNHMEFPKGVYVLQIVERPEIKEHAIAAVAKIMVDRNPEHRESIGCRLLVNFQKDSSAQCLKPGNLLLTDIRITNVTPPDHPGEFDYRRYLAARNIHKQAYLSSGSWKLSGALHKTNLKFWGLRFQDDLLQSYKKIGLNKTLNSILEAITLGYRNELEARTRQAFSQAGVMHVMALSGFNVAILAYALNFLLRAFRRFPAGRIVRTLVIIFVIWVFAIVTGLSPSVTRAAVMITFVLTGKLLCRHINTYNILFASAFFLLTLSPGLIADVSFQLSFTAVIGILLYYPVLYRFLHFRNFLADGIWKLFAVSCAAQLSTFPLILYYFHQFPVYFWLTNLVVVPLVSVIIVVAGFYLLASAVNPVALVTGKMLAILLSGLYKTVIITELLPFALLGNVHISLYQVLILMILVLFTGLFFVYRNTVLIFLSMIMLIGFQLLHTAKLAEMRDQKILLVANLKGLSAFNLLSGRKSVLWGDTGIISNNKTLQYNLSDFWIDHGVGNQTKIFGEANFDVEINRLDEACCKTSILGNNYLVIFSGKRVFFLQDDQFYRYYSDKPLTVDIVIVSGNVKQDPARLISTLKTKMIVLDSSVGKNQASHWQKDCRLLNLSCWNVTGKGAYLWNIRD